MKDVAVYTGYTEMLKGAGYRLAHLRGEIAIRIILGGNPGRVDM